MRVRKARTALVLAVILISIFLISCDHNVYMPYNDTWSVLGRNFGTFSQALDFLMANLGISRGTAKNLVKSTVPWERTIYLLRDVGETERGEAIVVPETFEGELCINFNGHEYWFYTDIDEFLDIRGGDRVDIINGKTVITEDTASRTAALCVDVRVVTVDEHLIDDRRKDPQAITVGCDGTLVVTSSSGNRTDCMFAGSFAIETGGILLIDEGFVYISDINDINPTAPGSFVITGGKVECPHVIEIIATDAVAKDKTDNVDLEIIHEYAPEWYTDATHHWHECTICGHKDDDYGEHAFTEWEEDSETLDWVRHCTVCELEQRESHVHTLTKVEAKDPTCTVDGNIEHWLCTHTGCGKLFLDSDAIEEVTAEQVSIPATDHDWSEEWSHDEEHHWHDCLNGCGEKADVADHSFSDWTYDSTDDRDHRTCDLCGQEESRNHLHELSHIEALEETCTEDGNMEYWHCVICGRYYSDQECTTEITLEDTVIPAKGHDWNEGWTYDDDHHWHVCDNNCGEKDGVADHVWSDWSYDEELKALVRICSICGAKDIEGHEHSSDTWVTIDPINHWKVCSCGTTFATDVHTFTDWTYDSELDKDTRECTVCGRTETRNHVHGTLIYTEGNDATCTEEGNEEYWHCTLCERYYLDADCTMETTLDGTVIPAKGHEMGNWEVTTEPTCTEKGEETRYCQRCDYYETREVEATGHSVETIARLEPTCTEDGHILYYHCTNCVCYFFDVDCTEEIEKAKLDFPAEEGGVVLEALGHIVKYVYNDDEHMAYCERCSEVLLDWHPHHWDEGTPCEDGQHIVYTCTVCGAIRNATLPEFETYYIGIGTLLVPTMTPSPCGEIKVTRNGNVYTVSYEPHLNSNTDYDINCRYMYNGRWSKYLTKTSDLNGNFSFIATGDRDYYIVMQIFNEGGTITRTMYVNNSRPIGE